MLLLTGTHDTTGGTTGPDRLALFDLIESDQVMLVSTDDVEVGHTTFNLETGPCRRAGGSRDRCTETVQALGMTARAFLRSALSALGLDPERLVATSVSRLPARVKLRAAGS